MKRTSILSLITLLFVAQHAASEDLCSRFPDRTLHPPSPNIRFALPIELTDGFIGGRSGATLFTASLRAHPSLQLSPSFQVGASTALSYTNPAWEVFGGPRILYKLVTLEALPYLSFASINLFGEGLFGHRGNNYIAMGLQIGMGKLLITGIRHNRILPLSSEERSLEGSFGLDPTAFSHEDRANPEIGASPGEPERSYYTVLRTQASLLLKTAFGTSPALRDSVRREFGDFDFQGSTRKDLEAYVRAKGLPRLAYHIGKAETEALITIRTTDIMLPASTDEDRALEALLAGWCDALKGAGR